MKRTLRVQGDVLGEDGPGCIFLGVGCGLFMLDLGPLVMTRLQGGTANEGAPTLRAYRGARGFGGRPGEWTDDDAPREGSHYCALREK